MDVSGLKKGAGQAQSALRSLQGVAGAVFAGLGLGAAAGFGAVLKSAIDMNATLETTQLQFETLMGSADEARDHVASLFEIAKKTPFETGPIIEASKFLQTFGGDALNTEDNILQIGDAAAATNAPIQDLGFWVGRLYSNLQAGQPFGEAAMRLQELAVLSPQARQQMEALQKSGASAAEIFAIFEKDLGRFSGAMEKQAGTWQGLMSTISDSVKLALAEGLQPFFEGAKSGLQTVAAALSDPATTEGIKTFAAELGKITAEIVPLALEYGPELVKTLAAVAAVLGTLTVISKVVAGFTALKAAVLGAKAAFAAAEGGAISGIIAVLGGPLTVVVGAIIALVALLAVAWAKDWGGIREKTAEAVASIRGIIEKGLDAIRAFWEQHGEGIMHVVSNLWAAVARWFEMGWKNLMLVFGAFKALFTGDWEELGRKLRQIVQNIIDGVRDILGHLGEAIRPALEAAAKRIKAWWESIDWKAIGRKAWEDLKGGFADAGRGGGDGLFPKNTIYGAAAASGFEAGQRAREAFQKGWQAESAANEPWAVWAADEAQAVAERRADEIAQAAASADRALIEFAKGYEFVADSAEEAAVGLDATAVAARLAGDRFKLAADNGRKLGNGLDGLTAAADRGMQALARARAEIEAFNAAFAGIQGDYTRELPGGDKPLVREERTVSVVTGGPTAEQTQLIATYQEKIKALQEDVFDLTNGIGTFGVEQDKVTEKIEKANAEIAYYQGLLEPLAGITGEVSTAHQGLSVNVDAVHQALYDQLVQMGAAPDVITAYAVAVGIMSEEQARAALAAAAVQVKIEELAGKIAEGLPIETALADLDTFIDKIENGVDPAAATLAADVPQHITDMKDAMSEGALDAGKAVPTNIETGIRDNLSTVETAAGDMATAVIDTVNGAFGVESPSTVFAETGRSLLLGLTEGMAEGQPEAVTLSGDIGQDVTDAWDETIDGAPSIGENIILGIIAGLNARRGELVAEMTAIALEAKAAAEAALEMASPSRVFAEIGQNIILGLIEGLDEEEGALYDKLIEIADKLYSIGSGVFDLFIAPLDKEINDLNESLDELGDSFDDALAALSPFSTDAVIENIGNMTAAEAAAALRGLRFDPTYMNNPEALRRLNEAIRLADERVLQEQQLGALEEEHLRRQEELKRLEEARAKLDFLKMQVELLNLIRDNNLDASILDGLELGLDANMEDIIAAMTAAVEQLVQRTSDELGIASPSTVFMEIGKNVMAGFAEGLRETDAAEARLREAMRDVAAVGAIEGARAAEATTAGIEKGLAEAGSARDRLRELAGGLGLAGLADPRGLEARLRQAAGRVIRVNAEGLNPAQTVNIYGGYNVALRDRASAEPLRELFYEDLQYQG